MGARGEWWWALAIVAEPELCRAMNESASVEVRIRCRRLRDEILGKPRSILSADTGGVEGLAFAQQVIHRPPQLRRQRPQRPRLAALTLLPRQPLLRGLALAEQQAGGLAEGPLQMRVADALVLAALLLAGALVRTAHQPSITQELTDLREALHVVNLVEED